MKKRNEKLKQSLTILLPFYFEGVLDQEDPFKVSNSSKMVGKSSSLKGLLVEIQIEENTFPVGANS